MGTQIIIRTLKSFNINTNKHVGDFEMLLMGVVAKSEYQRLYIDLICFDIKKATIDRFTNDISDIK